MFCMLVQLRLRIGIGESDWAFRTSFQVDQELLSAPAIELIFQGLDTFCKVELVRNILRRIEQVSWDLKVSDCRMAESLLSNILLSLNIYAFLMLFISC